MKNEIKTKANKLNWIDKQMIYDSKYSFTCLEILGYSSFGIIVLIIRDAVGAEIKKAFSVDKLRFVLSDKTSKKPAELKDKVKRK